MISAINASTQEAGSAAQESSRVAGELSAKAARLQTLFERFNVR